jgi:hypothetical protein
MPVQPAPAPPANHTLVTWPADTDIVFVEGTSRVILTLQRPLIRLVIQEGFEILCAHLLFAHAFPDGNMISSLVKESLLGGAMSKMPRAAVIYKRLMCDEQYAPRMWPLVSFQMSNMI